MSQSDEETNQDMRFTGALAQDVPKEKIEELDEPELRFVAPRAGVIAYPVCDEDLSSRTIFQDIEESQSGDAWISALDEDVKDVEP